MHCNVLHYPCVHAHSASHSTNTGQLAAARLSQHSPYVPFQLQTYACYTLPDPLQPTCQLSVPGHAGWIVSCGMEVALMKVRRNARKRHLQRTVALPSNEVVPALASVPRPSSCQRVAKLSHVASCTRYPEVIAGLISTIFECRQSDRHQSLVPKPGVTRKCRYCCLHRHGSQA